LELDYGAKANSDQVAALVDKNLLQHTSLARILSTACFNAVGKRAKASQIRLLRCAPQAPLYTLLHCNANVDFAPFVAIPEVHG
jgi:hypothetical protein